MALQQAFGVKLWAREASADAIAAGGDPDIVLPMRALFRIGRGERRFYRPATFRMFPSGSLNHATFVPPDTYTSPLRVIPGMS